MLKHQIGTILSQLASKSAMVDLTAEDQTKVAQLINELRAIFDPYPKKQ
jgi:hypothetical protein